MMDVQYLNLNPLNWEKRFFFDVFNSCESCEKDTILNHIFTFNSSLNSLQNSSDVETGCPGSFRGTGWLESF